MTINLILKPKKQYGLFSASLFQNFIRKSKWIGSDLLQMVCIHKNFAIAEFLTISSQKVFSGTIYFDYPKKKIDKWVVQTKFWFEIEQGENLRKRKEISGNIYLQFICLS